MAIVVPVISTFDAKGINKAIQNFKNLEGGAAKTGFVLRAMDQGMMSVVKTVAKAGAALGALGGIVGTKLVMAGYESQKVFAQTAQIIQNTGFAAGHTAESITAMTEKLSEQIGVDDELIQKSANLLLTFRQVQNQGTANNAIFDRAVVAAQDLANVFGSAEGAAMQLGKALADPVRGITALRRSGVNFTETQQEMIKNFMAQGKLLEAQKIILGEVEAQVGGTAKATATDFDRMKVAVGNLAEDIGRMLIPHVERLARFIKDQVLPYIKNLVDIFGEEGVSGVLKKLGGDFVGFITNLEGTGAKVYWLITAMVALRAAVIGFQIATTIATVVAKTFNLTIAANPIGLAVAALMALVVALVAAYLKFEGFRKVVNTVINFVIGYFENMANFWIRAINLVIAGIKKLGPVLKYIGIDVSKLGPIAEVTFPRISTAAKKATVDINKFGNAVEEARFKAIGQRIGATDPDDPTGGGGGESAIERAKRQLKEYTDALKKVKEAQSGLSQSSRSLADAQKNARLAAVAVTEAQNALKVATDNVRKAELNLEKVRRGLGAGSDESKVAALAVGEAQRELEESGYRVEDAQFAVIDATQKLAELRTREEAPTAREVREAEIALARAKLGLTEANIGQQKATKDLASAQKEYNEITNGATEDTDRYKEALAELNEAKQKQEEATDKVIEAMEKERDAVEKITEAQEKLRDATWEVFDAEKALRELRSQIPKDIKDAARKDIAAREGFAPGVTIPSGVQGLVTLPDVVDVASSMVGGGNGGATYNTTINSQSLNPADAADYVVEALRQYERSNGFIPVRVDSAVYAI